MKNPHINLITIGLAGLVGLLTLMTLILIQVIAQFIASTSGISGGGRAIALVTYILSAILCAWLITIAIGVMAIPLLSQDQLMKYRVITNRFFLRPLDKAVQYVIAVRQESR